MSNKITERVAPGIYKTARGYRVKVSLGDRKRGGRSRETTFPADAGMREMKGWQTQARAELSREDIRPVLGTLAADVERYLDLPKVRKLASYKTRVSDTKAWNPRFGNMRRDQMTTPLIQRQVDDWNLEGVAPWTVRHRINALRQVYLKLDGESAYNPVLDVLPPSKPRQIPRALNYDTIRTTFNQMEPSATKGFLMILAFCGFRPSEVRRTEPWMVHLDDEEPWVLRNTSKGGDVTPVPLSEEGILAWRMFLQHEGLEVRPEAKDRLGRPRQTRTFPNANRDWKAAMSRASFTPTRCYDLVHSYCTQLQQVGGADTSMVQKVRGHKDIRTTQIYTQVVVDPRIAGAVRRAFALKPAKAKTAS